MAILTADQLQSLRSLACRQMATQSWTKPQINAALQGIEDAVQSANNVGAKTLQTYIGSAVETAAPGVFTAGQKDNLFVLWSLFNAQRGGIV